jgi:glucose/arabinose dehydrogenase
MRFIWPSLAITVGIVGIVSVWFAQNPTLLNKIAFAPKPQAAQPLSSLPLAQQNVNPDIQIVADGLEIPWEIAFLPDDTLLITERPGRLVKIGKDRKVIPINGVRHVGEGGLLGLALHPQFSQNGFSYLYLTSQNGSTVINRVERYRLRGTTLSDRVVIINNIPGSTFHDGGRIAFGPDGLLYITTGDAGNENNAQDTQGLAGKILRLHDDGSIPEDNPFNNEIYSWGHRNPQGLTWDRDGNLWATEHGRSGIATGFDEVNLITKGSNFGWPTIQGDRGAPNLQTPKAHSGANTTWAPSGAVYSEGRIFFAGLRGEAIYEAVMSGTNITSVKTHLANQFGRLRTITNGPDGDFYILTNNTDGRGTPKPNDDKIIKMSAPALLK